MNCGRTRVGLVNGVVVLARCASLCISPTAAPRSKAKATAISPGVLTVGWMVTLLHCGWNAPMVRSRHYRPRYPTHKSRLGTASFAFAQPVAGTVSRLPEIHSASSTTCWMGSSVLTRHNATLGWPLARTARWMSRPRLERGQLGRAVYSYVQEKERPMADRTAA